MSNPNMQPSQLGFIGDFLSSDCGAKVVSISITLAIIFVIASYYQLWTVAIICLGAVIILPIIVAACLIVSEINCRRTTERKCSTSYVATAHQPLPLIVKLPIVHQPSIRAIADDSMPMGNHHQ